MRRRDWIVAGFGLAATGVAIFAVGGAHREAQATVAVLVACATAVQLVSRSAFERFSPLLLLLGLAAGLTALQLLPLPHGLVSILDPTGAGLRTDGTTLAGVTSGSTLTLDAPGSLRALVFLLTLVGVAAFALRLATTERGRYLLIAAVSVGCGLAAAVVGVHVLFGMHRLYGIYTPEHATPSVLGPLLNENQLGCLMALGAVTSLGLVMYPRQRSWVRVAWLLVTAGCAVATMASHSRGAALALLAGLVIAGAAMVGQRISRPPTPQKRRMRFMTRSLPIGVVAACTVIVIVYASAGGISRELARTSLQEIHAPKSKYATWSSAAILIEESPWVGVGRGAFEPAFTRVHPASAFATFSHLENEYLQAVVDWGVPGALALGILAIWVIVSGLRKWRDGPLAAAGLGALAVVALQSNVDFGIELLGLAVPTTLVAATLAYVPLREAKGRALLASRGPRLALVGALLIGALLLTTSATNSVADDHAALRDKKVLTLDDLRPMIARHPLDYYGYALAAQVSARDGISGSVRMLNHALILHPTHPGLHVMAAHLLYTTGRIDQSAIEFASALRYTVDPAPLVAEIVALFPAELAAAAIPTDSHSPDEIVRTIEALSRPEVAAAWLSRVLDQRPGNLKICGMLYDLSLKQGDLRVIELAARRCEGFEPDTASKLQLAQLLVKQHKNPEALELLKDVDIWPGRVGTKIQGWILMCDIYIDQHAWSDAKKCIRRLDGSGYSPPEFQGELTRRLEQINTEMKNALVPLPVPAPDAGSASQPR